MAHRSAFELVLPPGATRRVRKFAALTLIIWVATVLAVVLEVATGKSPAAIGNAAVMVTATFVLLALRQGVSVLIVTPILLGVGLADAAFVSISSGLGGALSIVWMTTAPLIALSVGGRRAGWFTLGLSLVAILITLIGIEQQWLVGTVRVDRSLASRGLTVLAFAVVVFLLTRAYEVETEASIAKLETQNEALRAARAEAEQANRAKSDFLSTMSHELRTPLNGVTSMALLLRDERDPTRLREGLQVIERSADMLLAVITDVLDFSKIESMQLDLETIPVSVEHELQAVVSVLQPAAAEQGTALDVEVAREVPPWVRGDPTRLRQIATNLIANAVKFTKRGQVTCRLTAHQQTLTLEVADTGIGMTPETLDRIFKPFIQADSSTTRKFGGTGLGLVITSRLVEAMGGQITVESQREKGSRFTVTLPFVATEPPPSADALTSQLVTHPRRVLLVEDNAVNQMVARKLIEKLGHQVTLAANGRQALEACETGTFDVVLMDCHMPSMDGFEATRQLRAKGFVPPIIALTAAVSNEDREECLACGMNGVLSKPVRIDRLIEVLAAAPTRAAPPSRAEPLASKIDSQVNSH